MEVPVRPVSALTGLGVSEIWGDVKRFREAREATGSWEHHRRSQLRAALWSEIEDGLIEAFRATRDVADRLAALEADVVAGRRTPAEAARELLAAFLDQA